MPRSAARAVLFDLDDTLYPQRRFILSGFAAVARYLDARDQVDAAGAFQALCAAFRTGAHGREIQICLERHRLAPTLLPALVDVMRGHRPALRLPRQSRDTLHALRGEWRTGIVTNGMVSIQAGKIAALGLEPLVDAIIYACDHGGGRGKPDPEPFEAALERLGVEPQNAVFVGDNEIADVLGAGRAGLHTVRLCRRGQPGPSAADAVIRCVSEVPGVAAQLVDRAWSSRPFIFNGERSPNLEPPPLMSIVEVA